MLTAAYTNAAISSPPLLVQGRARLNGVVHAAGFKHALVSIVAASCASHGQVTLGNCPDLVETSTLAELIDALGGLALYSGNTLIIEAARLSHGEMSRGVANRIHGSVYLLPALVGRFGEAAVPTGGGCPIGSGTNGRRPVSHYIDVFQRFGARAAVDGRGDLRVSATRLTGCELDLLDYTADRQLRTGPLYSGASKIALLCAAVAYGTSTLRNLYPKPDVTELVEFLRVLGADIEEASTSCLVLHGAGPERLSRDVGFTLPADLIEVVTWICAGALLSDDRLTIGGAGLDRAWRALAPERSLLEQMEVPVSAEGETLVVGPVEETQPVDVLITSPGIYSDCQPLFSLLATRGRGRSRVTETVWSNRFDHVEGLNRLGARLEQAGSSVTIEGGHRPHIPGQHLRANDLRSAATLLLAALEVEGETVLSGAGHLARGYPDLPAALCKLGAKIEWTHD